MHYDFCTLFDRNYLFKGLALHESLQRHVADFTLWVLCMDDLVYEVLETMRLPQLELISLAQFEDEDLLRAKGTRTQVEYCWTCTPSLPLYLLDHVPGIESITYLDADLYFFTEPTGVNREMIAGSIGIIEHRLSKEYASFAENVGIYNVAMMVFKNDRHARDCLVWWRDRCNEWCYSRAEDGKYGDQKYLDDWPQRFPGVVVLQDPGVGLAPWNVRSHRLAMRNERVFVDGKPLVFYHFHLFSIVGEGEQFRLVDPFYKLGGHALRLLYRPYVASVKRAMSRVRQIDPAYAYGVSSERPDARFAHFMTSARGQVDRAGHQIERLVRAAILRSGLATASKSVESSAPPGGEMNLSRLPSKSRCWDILLANVLRVSAPAFRKARAIGLEHLPETKTVLLSHGVFPIIDHYYEPLFNTGRLDEALLSRERRLPGIEWNLDAQLMLLETLDYGEEASIAMRTVEAAQPLAPASSFLSGDAEFWFSMIRHFKPRQLIEIGSGQSTLLAIAALEANSAEAPTYGCRHVCIEPYEQPWLESTAVEVVRARAEDVPSSLFETLREGDILFLDSSHIIRPQGDVLAEYLEILPYLAPGVIVHVHDVFSPRDYPAEWIVAQNKFWNEQYLLEAFLTHNRDWEILAALNLLHHSHPDALRRVCPALTADREPGSFYIRRRS